MLLHRSNKLSGQAERSSRHGMTLLEVIAALSITAALAGISAAGFRIAAVSTVSTATTAQSLSLELAKTRRLAIQSGESHGLRFVTDRGRISGFVPYKRSWDGIEVRLQPATLFPADTEIGVSDSAIEFTPEGLAAGAAEIKLAASARAWHISVVPATGAVLLQEL